MIRKRQQHGSVKVGKWAVVVGGKHDTIEMLSLSDKSAWYEVLTSAQGADCTFPAVCAISQSALLVFGG